MIIGHSKIVEASIRAFEGDRFQHAYIFVGRNSVGKRTVARYLASSLLKTSFEKIDIHPDFFYVERSVDEKTGKHKKDITIEQARTIKQKLQTKSWSGGFQVVVLDEAERLNEEASNALLKILEEPPEKSIVFLLTTDDEALLPTIRSRAQTVSFPLVSEEIIKQGLVDRGCGEEKASELAYASWGRPGRALSFLHDEELYRDYQKEIERFKKLLHQPFHVKLKIIEDIFGSTKGGGEKQDHIKQREELVDILEIWEMQWRDILLAGEKNNEYKKYASQTIITILNKLEEARKLLRQNIHPRLVVENIVLDF